MSQTVEDSTLEDQALAHEIEHNNDATYIKVALVLGVITAVEVGTYYVDLSNSVLVPSLIVMMMVKFWIVGSFFMHLRYDKPLFSKLFYAGVAMALACYVVTLLTFQFFD